MRLNRIIQGDTLRVLKTLPDDFVDTIITSPPYWGLRDYGVKGQIGLEPTLEEYLNKLLKITKELQRVLKPTGVMFWNHGDNYSTMPAGNQKDWKQRGGDGVYDRLYKRNQQGIATRKTSIPEKCLCLQNYRLLLKMIDEQEWILRNVIVWHKPNHMPSSVKDRFANSYEPVFMLVKKKKYWFDLDAVRVSQTSSKEMRFPSRLKAREFPKGRKGNWEPPIRKYNPSGKNPGDVWKIATQPFPEAHFATFPEKLIEPMIKSSCPQWICKKCGKARVRIGKKIYEKAHNRGKNYKQIKGTNSKTSGKAWKDGGWNELPSLKVKEVKTLGWTDCGCKAGFKPGIVLDPFMGSGTTALVARKLARKYLGIELSKEYIKIAEKRLSQQVLL